MSIHPPLPELRMRMIVHPPLPGVLDDKINYVFFLLYNRYRLHEIARSKSTNFGLRTKSVLSSSTYHLDDTVCDFSVG